ncbi:NAD-dependent epimerase/dehydratase family protein [Bacillus timonensis]|uniref:NAD-dependent epimerase/dehydratase family protein n=1 Tax=Bacillus timonensis TaxID=1033734 RepID=UPI000287C031|nr:NAD-dependent epimerase/dehydratase family protein [Bacillus timonensis]
MKILVTGGSGFIGSHLVTQLIAQGHDVITLDDLSNGKISLLNQVMDNPKHTFIQGSVLDRSLLNELMDQVDVVFHLAAVLGVKNLVEHPLKVIEGNIDGTRNVLEFAFARKQKVVFSSTSEVYGKNNNLPYNEDSDRVLGSTLKNRWCYATAKALDEHLCFAYAEKGLPITVVRYFNAYGPGATTSDYGMVIPKFIKAALTNSPITVYGDGNQTRCFTYIDDTVQGTIKCMDSNYNGEVFNIGRDEEISINQLANKIKFLCNSNSDIIHIPYDEIYGEKYEDTPKRIPNNEKARSLLGFSPLISIDEGLRKTIAYYQNELGYGSDR